MDHEFMIQKAKAKAARGSNVLRQFDTYVEDTADTKDHTTGQKSHLGNRNFFGVTRILAWTRREVPEF